MVRSAKTPLISSIEIRGIYYESTRQFKAGRHAPVFGVGMMCYVNPHGFERKIKKMLDSLPESFRVKLGGDNWINACVDRNGTPWTNSHTEIGQLVILGQAIGRIRIAAPPDEWRNYPLGFPPFVYLNSLFRKKED